MSNAPSGFSLEASRAGGVAVQFAVHPGGPDGAKFSIDKMIEKIRAARRDWRLRKWAGKKLIAAGKPTSKSQQCAVLLNAVRAQTMYGFDPPNTEFIAAPAIVLCLDAAGDDGGDVCIPIVDCDELTCTCIAILQAAGIDDVYIAAHAYDLSGVPSHVLFAVKTESGLERGDPSTKLPFGQSQPCAQEWIIDPMKNDPTYFDGQGDYIGVGRPSSIGYGMLGQVGFGDAGQVTTDVYNNTVSQMKQAQYALKKAFLNLRSSIDQVTNAQSLLSPNQAYDPEPGWVVDFSTLPSGGVWTQSMATLGGTLFAWAAPLLSIADDALSGARQIMLDDSNPGDAYVQSLPADSFKIVRVLQSVEEDVIAVTDGAGNVLGGFSSSTGAAYTAATIQSKITAAGKALISGLGFSGAQGMGLAPVAIVAIVVGAVLLGIVCSIATYYAIAKLCDMLSVKAQEATNQKLMECIQANANNPTAQTACLNAGKVIADNRVAIEKQKVEENKSDPFARAMDSIASAVTWVVIGGVIVGGIYLGAPLVKGLFEELKARKETKAAKAA